jgi:hypothetical protein
MSAIKQFPKLPIKNVHWVMTYERPMGRRSRSRTGLLDVRWMPRPAKQLQAGAAAAASGHLAPDLDGCHPV